MTGQTNQALDQVLDSLLGDDDATRPTHTTQSSVDSQSTQSPQQERDWIFKPVAVISKVNSITSQEWEQEYLGRRAAIVDSFGVKIDAIYCSATGGIIGHIDQSIVELTDLELTNKQLVEQCLLSARPSPGWTIKRRSLYPRFRQYDPVGLLTHLVAIIFDALEANSKQPSIEGRAYSTRWRSTELHCEFLRNKIRLRSYLDSLNASKPDALRKALDRALELDARRGLHTVEPPYNINFAMLVDSFEERFVALMDHCESELELARVNELKVGTYFSRQVVEVNDKPKSIRRKNAEHQTQKAKREADVLEAFLTQIDVDSLAGLKDYNRVIEESTPKAKGAALNETRVSAEISRRLQHYQSKHAKTRIVSAKTIKL